MSAPQKTDVQVGNRYGALTVVALRRKPRTCGRTEAQARCQCNCGRVSWYAESKLRHGHSVLCHGCTATQSNQRRPQFPLHERWLRRQEKTYRGAASKRGYVFELTQEQFRTLYQGTCAYCAQSPAYGIDRRNNAVGYTVENSTPCCSTCNYAKRDMSAEEFISWAKRVYQFRGWKK